MKPTYIFLAVLQIFLVTRQEAAAQKGQRKYSQHSVLQQGSWYKLLTAAPGIYRIDVPLLNSLGINTQQLPTSAIHLHGTGGRMLPEPNEAPRYDDLPEVALFADDGGDGYFNGNDYILFYAPGPHQWTYNPLLPGYSHQRNLYSDSACYFITTGSNGARIEQDNADLIPDTREDAFDFLAFHERDSINFLNSGKQWWGQEFSKVLGNSRTYGFSLPAPAAGPVTIGIRAAARSATGCNFNVSINKAAAASVYLLPVGGSIFEDVATAASATGAVNAGQQALDVQVDFAPGDINSRGWLDYLEVQARCRLVKPATAPLIFRSIAAVSKGKSIQYALYNVQGQTQLWDVTNPLRPVAVKKSQQGDSLLFTRPGDQLREFVAFNSGEALRPLPGGMVRNQDLHGAGSADLIIVTVTSLRGQAERLASWHRSHDQLTVLVATMEQIYNEFSSGSPDPTALRDFVKMYFDREPEPRYLLLFGAASYDYRDRVKNNTNYVPSWQSEASLDAIHSYVSDDYFGFLDDKEDITRNDIPNLLDIGIGRLPVRSNAEAVQAVDKIIRYSQPPSFGTWRNQFTFLADDEDNNLHFNDAEYLSGILAGMDRHPEINKIYVDAYPQETTGTGQKSPQVNKAIAERINKGTLVLNYTGHGSTLRLADETVMDAASIADWRNENRLPLFITATCDFAPFDDPAVNSLGQQVLLQHSNGAIALMTTTRAVFANANRISNSNYLKVAFTPQADGSRLSLGAAAQQAKNNTYRTSGDIINNRKFQLLGDPALTLAFPRYRVITDSINGKAAITETDTLKSLQQCIIKGHIADAQGRPLKDYSGTLSTVVYDKPATFRTRGNDPGSQPAAYTLQQNILFKGQQSVANGQFTVTFTVPQDIATGTAAGRISYYVYSDQTDGNGAFEGFTATGQRIDAPADKTGPDVKAWLDSRSFSNGNITSPDPLLILDLADSSGINISGNNPAHNLTARLDDGDYFILNDYFEATLNSYRKGNVSFLLRGLSVGDHKITVEAWDTYNNSTVTSIYFKVAESGDLAVEEVVNYPNPFRGATKFSFVHNQPEQQLDVDLQVFTTDGRLVKTMRNTIFPGTGRFEGIPWDGHGDTGARLPAGIYFYRLIIKSNGKTRVKGGKMVLL
ncbi:MAG TPA: type IX secretion system sortase PorU [Chitinophaga sp.]|uniref:type IX secretion system sortase PorU n=1 Tax=Chitinophaga sp. TaxID=1869181 RepID=UPI002C3AB355|nr:type IX secretion system sortase PorU [Chitinophaga sp.]HVI45528.1 type IX secretion system sortase PorU [Chitinophaga sp.]